MSRRIRQRRKRLQVNNSDSLIYSGDVSLSLKIKNKLYAVHTHNQGLTPMFQLIALSITGKYTSNLNLIPKYIRITNSGRTENKTELIEINSAVPSPEDGGGYISTFTAMISRTHFAGESIVLGDCICLVSGGSISDLQTLSYVTINTKELVDNLNNLKDISGATGQLEWTIRVTNNSETISYNDYR